MKHNGKKSIWYHEKVKAAFFKLCEKSYEPKVNWKKFRHLDRKGVFAAYTNSQLSMKFRKFWLIKNGICYYCGKNKPESEGGLCRKCLDKMNEYMKGKRKEEEDD